MKLSFFTALLFILTIQSIEKVAAQDTIPLSISPNPFSEQTTLQFTLLEFDTVSLSISNNVGQTLITFFSDVLLPAGSYSIIFNADTLPDEVYNAMFKVDSIFQVKKLVKSYGVSVNETEIDKSRFLAFPNPADTYLYISGLFDIGDEINLFSMDGKLLKVFQIENSTIQRLNLSEIESKVLFLKIRNKEGVLKTTHTIIKQ